MAILQVISNYSNKLYDKELYIVADSIEEHAGAAIEFSIQP